MSNSLLNRIALIPPLVLTLVSCQKEADIDPPFKYINISFYENFTSSGPELWFRFETRETFPCSNFSLKVDVISNPGHTEIFITDIEELATCTTALGPAMRHLNLGPSQPGQHRFKIWVNNYLQEIELYTTGQYIAAKHSLLPDDFLIMAHDTLRRIPPNTVWGVATYNPTEKNKILWDEIATSFQNVGGVPVNLSNGYYHYFNITNGIMTVNGQTNSDQTIYFRFEKALQILADEFNKIALRNLQPEISIALYNSMGEKFITPLKNK